MKQFIKNFCILFASTIGFLLPNTAFAEQTFSDVSTENPLHEAVTYLKERNIIQGYDDGTFKPYQEVNRAEAIKMLIAPLVNQSELAQQQSTVYSDIKEGSWYLPYTEVARKIGVIDGPPAKPQFYGNQTVVKVEFLKMLLLANSEDPYRFGEIRLPVATDVTNPDEWYYPYMRFALSSSMTLTNEDGLLEPGRRLTRGDTATLLYRYMLYKEGDRTQQLLFLAQEEIVQTLNHLEVRNIIQAEFSSARALLAARGAHATEPDDEVVQGALKISEAFRALTEAHRAALLSNHEKVINLAGNSWNLADRAKDINSEIDTLSNEVQKAAAGLADSARMLKDS